MNGQKTFEFNGTAGGYFLVFLLTIILTYIPFFGWALVFNYTSNWMVENSRINGRQLQYKAGYGETLKFVFLNYLLVIITLGIYIFWFVPKSYRYIVNHVEFADTSTNQPPVAPLAATPPQQPPTSYQPPIAQPPVVQ